MRERERKKLLATGAVRAGARGTPAHVQLDFCRRVAHLWQRELAARKRPRHQARRIGEVRRRVARDMNLSVSEATLKRWWREYTTTGLTSADGMNGDLASGLRDGHGQPTQKDYGEYLLPKIHTK